MGDYCQLQLASLPAEALKLYRGRVDAAARKWFEEGVARRDRKLLENVVSQAFASSYGDKALLALGEIALESGDCAAARAVLGANPSRRRPAGPAADVARLSRHDARPGHGPRPAGVGFDLGRRRGSGAGGAGGVRSPAPRARGRLGGREVNFAEALGQLAAQSVSWPNPPVSPDWPTFAGNPARDKIAPRAIDAGQIAWRVPLSKDPSAAAGAEQASCAGPRAELLSADGGRSPVLQRRAGDCRRAVVRRTAALGRIHADGLSRPHGRSGRGKLDPLRHLGRPRDSR